MPNDMQGYRASRDQQGILRIHDVPIFVECQRGEHSFDKGWIEQAVQAAHQAAKEGYHPPLHLRHHEAASEVKAAGYFCIKGTGRLTFKGAPRLAVLADLVITDPTVQEHVLAQRLPYRSVEIFDVNEPRIDSLALLDHEAPYLELPMLMVSQVSGAEQAQADTVARIRNPIEGQQELVACFQRGRSAHVLLCGSGAKEATRLHFANPSKNLQDAAAAHEQAITEHEETRDARNQAFVLYNRAKRAHERNATTPEEKAAGNPYLNERKAALDEAQGALQQSVQAVEAARGKVNQAYDQASRSGDVDEAGQAAYEHSVALDTRREAIEDFHQAEMKYAQLGGLNDDDARKQMAHDRMLEASDQAHDANAAVRKTREAREKAQTETQLAPGFDPSDDADRSDSEIAPGYDPADDEDQSDSELAPGYDPADDEDESDSDKPKSKDKKKDKDAKDKKDGPGVRHGEDGRFQPGNMRRIHMADSEENKKDADGEDSVNMQEEGGVDVGSIVGMIEDGSISVADMDAIVAAVEARKAMMPGAEMEEPEAAPAEVPDEVMSYDNPKMAMARLMGETKALRARLEERERAETRDKQVRVAMQRLDGRPLGSNLEQELHAFHRKFGEAAFEQHVSTMERTFAAYETDPRSAFFAAQTRAVPEVANRYLKDGAEAVERAAMFARQHEELAQRGHVRMSVDRYVELNMSRN